MTPGARSQRERICLGCREKLCCYYYTVTVTGRDVWRIARAIQIAPSDFLSYHESTEQGEGRFLLSPDGPFYELALAKRPVPGPLPSRCIFLLQTNDAHALCGLGELRPAQCQAYPVYLGGGLVRLINDPAGCVRTWSYAEIAVAEERERLGRLMAEEAEHRGTVREWNERVRQDGRERSFEEFCAYLVNRYAGGEDTR